MDKNWLMSMTFWGALGYGIVTALEQLVPLYPEAAVIAKAISGFLVIFGIRRAVN